MTFLGDRAMRSLWSTRFGYLGGVCRMARPSRRARHDPMTMVKTEHVQADEVLTEIAESEHARAGCGVGAPE